LDTPYAIPNIWVWHTALGGLRPGLLLAGGVVALYLRVCYTPKAGGVPHAQSGRTQRKTINPLSKAHENMLG